MAAKDIFHEAVKRALEKDQLIITKEPLELEWEEVIVKINLGAERLIAANRGNEKIAVEIKSFVSISAISSFHTALGQFLNYRIMLEVNDPERLLYLAVPVEAYQTFFQSRLAQVVIKPYQLKLIIYKPKTEEIIQWIS
ncbi:MAG: fatty-acid oxidation protein subunit alpha [Okeania sp. SIO2C9]|uniref:XisH family protein n=1 Tax=Okeania sp. SIO2C9 TaxID=2607791 RepID=UPI0013BF2B21|nr:XisH family protein [Okeania sp. SIO2C9]NEQ73537.1 fatty-acid oxidation protein subunit alpha [Okeania sp. SIO2C9]